MLGSVQDAEDALQDALLRAWKALDRFEGRSSPRSWLYRIATNTCLDAIARRPQARAADRPRRDEAPLAETVWLEPYPDDARRRALRAARERRAGVHRRAPAPAGQPARGADPARGARLQRQGGRGDARHDARLGQQRDAARAGRRSTSGCPQQLAAGDAADARRRARSASWSSATSRRGTAATSTPSSAMLAEEATFSMPPNAEWFRGREAIREFLPTRPAVDPAHLRARRAPTGSSRSAPTS